jgi:hypothetical protein
VTKRLEAGRLYPFKVEWYNDFQEGDLVFKYWRAGEGVERLVRTPALYPPDAQDQDGSGTRVNTTFGVSGLIRFYSALNYGETHFLRYRLGAQDDEAIGEDEPVGSSSVHQDTWGFGFFGKAKYREQDSTEPSWLRSYPSAISLGRLMAAPPLSVNTIRRADTRLRGGGITASVLEFYAHSGSALVDSLAGFWDLGLWDGPPTKDGGSVQVTLPASLRERYSDEQIRALVLKRIPPGVELHLTFEEGV